MGNQWKRDLFSWAQITADDGHEISCFFGRSSVDSVAQSCYHLVYNLQYRNLPCPSGLCSCPAQSVLHSINLCRSTLLVPLPASGFFFRLSCSSHRMKPCGFQPASVLSIQDLFPQGICPCVPDWFSFSNNKDQRNRIFSAQLPFIVQLTSIRDCCDYFIL